MKKYKNLEPLTDEEFVVVLPASASVHPELPAFLQVCRAGIMTGIARHLDESVVKADCSEIQIILPSGTIRHYKLSPSGAEAVKRQLELNKKHTAGKLFPRLHLFGRETLRSKWYTVLRRCGLPKTRSLSTLSWRSPEDRVLEQESEVLEIICALERKLVPGLQHEGREAPVPPGYFPLQVVPGAPKTLPPGEPSASKLQVVPLKVLPDPVSNGARAT